MSDWDSAVKSCHMAIGLNPGVTLAHFNLGIALRSKGLLSEAMGAFQKAIELQPEFGKAYLELGIVHDLSGQYEQALVAFNKAVALDPNSVSGHLHAGDCLMREGKLDESIACCARAMQADPANAAAHSALIFAMQFSPRVSATELLDEQRRWNLKHAVPLKSLQKPHSNAPMPDRRLRIGYVSPDFNDHVQSFFTIPLLSHHDPQQVMVTAYSAAARPSAMTERMRGLCHSWRDIGSMSYDQAAELVRSDEIDILVDLTMHMANNRLTLFARKPAPIQVTWLAYPGSTGLDAIDYRFTDPYLDPPDGSQDSRYAEKTIRLPETFWCYDPLSADPPVNALPALTNGSVTFGCLNNFCKANESVLHLWAQLLASLPISRLLILAPTQSAENRVRHIMSSHAVDSSRIQCTRFLPRAEYLKLYHKIDIALDTVPYNGHTTSLDALWMGVPVVTLVGTTVVGRAGLSQLSNLRLTELVAWNAKQYVQIASDLAQDLPRLSGLRAALRDRMRMCALMDGPSFARDVEAAYREMWRRRAHLSFE